MQSKGVPVCSVLRGLPQVCAADANRDIIPLGRNQGTTIIWQCPDLIYRKRKVTAAIDYMVTSFIRTLV